MTKVSREMSLDVETPVEMSPFRQYQVQLALLEAHNLSRLKRAREWMSQEVIYSAVDQPPPPPQEDWVFLPETGAINTLMSSSQDVPEGCPELLLSSETSTCSGLLWGGAASSISHLAGGQLLPTHGLPSAVIVPQEGGGNDAFESTPVLLPTAKSSSPMDWEPQGFQPVPEMSDPASAAKMAIRRSYRPYEDDDTSSMAVEFAGVELRGPYTPSLTDGTSSSGSSFIIVGEEDDLSMMGSSPSAGYGRINSKKRQSSFTRKSPRAAIPTGLSSSRVKVNDTRIREMVYNGRIKTHKSPLGQFECRHCRKRVHRLEHLRRHERTHLPDVEKEWWGCPFGCGGAMDRKDNMKEHIRRRNCPKSGDVKKRAGDLGFDWIQMCKSEKGRKEIVEALGMRPGALEPVFPVGPPTPKSPKGGKR
ncbi:MAG: hypothetical protein M1823_004036 [Watsoniomyces obsoletus]|nr:MAG: hypothetical protein M1823_004036 [Watsoniomyces obsoletus]